MIQIVFAGNVQSADSIVLPKQVAEGLQKNVETLDPISLVWTQQRSSIMGLDALISRVAAGPGLYSFFEQEKNIFMWQDKCSFLYTLQSQVIIVGDIKSDENGKVVGEVKKSDIDVERTGLTTAMDFHNYYIGSSERDTNVSTGLSVFPIERTMNDSYTYPVFLQSYLPFIGFKFPTYGAELKSTPSSYILFLLENGRLINYSEDTVDGSQLLRIDVESDVLVLDISYTLKQHLFSCWVDPKYNYAVKRIDIKLPSGELILTAINSDFKKIPGKDMYLPQKTKVDYYFLIDTLCGTSDGPLYIQEYALIDCSTKKINSAQFNLKNTFQQAGVTVSERTLRDSKEGLSFIVPANPADLDRVIEAALLGKDFVPTPLPSTAAIVIKWLLCIAGIVMILYAAYQKFIKKS
ncbi:MAG: hypothetical protein LBJ00_14950 [Planctomycetaceae bacterium]|nr:hypothetical protein [Planctomycetaceae bacterium]